MLAPAGLTVRRRQFCRQRHYLAQAILDQTRLHGMMNVRLDHKRIAAHRLDRLRYQLVSRSHEEVVDLLQRFRPQQAQVVPKPAPIKVLFVLPVANAHHQPQGSVLLRQVLQFVVIEVATQPDRRQHRDRPVTQPDSAMVGTAARIHIVADQIEKLTPQLHLPVDMLQSAQDGDDLVATVQVQRYGIDGRAIQTRLLLIGQTHGNPPRRLAAAGDQRPWISRKNQCFAHLS